MIPLTVIGGFLGSGKTTLLNRVLTQESCRKFSVLVNDFGDFAIDGDVVVDHDGETITFANGCVCCTIGDDFVATIMKLLEHPVLPDHILVEASGVSDPRVIAEVAALHPNLHRDLVVVLVDAVTIMDRSSDPRLEDTVESQLQSADILVINKCDLIGDAQRESIHDWLSQRLPSIPILMSSHAEFSLDIIFDSFEEIGRALKSRGGGGSYSHDHVFSSLTVELSGCFNVERLREALSGLPSSVLRAKGIVETEQDSGEFYLIQLSGSYVDVRKLDVGLNIDPSNLCMVFVGFKNMPGHKWFNDLLCGLSGRRPQDQT